MRTSLAHVKFNTRKTLPRPFLLSTGADQLSVSGAASFHGQQDCFSYSRFETTAEIAKHIRFLIEVHDVLTRFNSNARL